MFSLNRVKFKNRFLLGIGKIDSPFFKQIAKKKKKKARASVYSYFMAPREEWVMPRLDWTEVQLVNSMELLSI